MLTIGDKAPDFKLLDQNGQEHSLAYHISSATNIDNAMNAVPPIKFFLIYFYPKDDTPGCTKEACTIAETYADFEAAGIKVFGISADSPESHKKFVEKYHLPFTLLSDLDKTTIMAYGALKESGIFKGGIARVSYLLNKSGTIVKIYPKVDPASHAGEILRDVAAI